MATIPPTPNIDTDALTAIAEKFADAVKAGQSKRKMTAGELVPVTVFNPTGDRNRKRLLKRKTYINRLDAEKGINTLHDEEISLLNQLKPGKFCKGLVVVKEIELDGEAKNGIHISWSKERDKVQNVYRLGDFKQILKMCIEEAKAPKSTA